MQEMSGIYIYLKAFNLSKWLTTFWTALHLLIIAIDRVNAVYKNTAWRQSRKMILCKTIALLIFGVLLIVPIILMQVFATRHTAKIIALVLISVGGTSIVFTFTLCYILILHRIVFSTKRFRSIETTNKHTSKTKTENMEIQNPEQKQESHSPEAFSSKERSIPQEKYGGSKENIKICIDKTRKEHRSERKTRRDRRTNRVVKQFLILTIVYLISFIPQAIGISLNILIFRYFSYANQIANPIVYFIMDKSFRKYIIRLFNYRSDVYKKYYK